nr:MULTISPECIES: DUF975 family protein [unclassified Enterococcus]
MKFCPNCGQEITEEVKFCTSCGFSFQTMTAPSIGEKTKLQINKMRTDKQAVLELETAEGLNVTRAEIKKEAQRKLSGRYGEWFKSILIYFIASTVISSLFYRACYKLFFSWFFDSIFFYFGYYNQTTSGLKLLFWFIIFVLAGAAFLVLKLLSQAIFQWSSIFTLRGQKADGVKIFQYFIVSQKNRVLLANALTTIYTFLWSLLFVIPGIVKSASYAMTNYLLEKDPEISANDAIKLSRQIMDGYKIEFLILRYSFYLWQFVNIFSCGLASFYILPYQNVTEIKFLDQLYEKYAANNQ